MRPGNILAMWAAAALLGSVLVYQVSGIRDRDQNKALFHSEKQQHSDPDSARRAPVTNDNRRGHHVVKPIPAAPEHNANAKRLGDFAQTAEQTVNPNESIVQNIGAELDANAMDDTVDHISVVQDTGERISADAYESYFYEYAPVHDVGEPLDSDEQIIYRAGEIDGSEPLDTGEPMDAMQVRYPVGAASVTDRGEPLDPEVE